MDEKLINAVRRGIYNRWFYAFLAFVCLLNVAAEILDMLKPGENFGLDLVSGISSAIAAVLAAAVFLDLHFRRGRP